MLFAHSSNNRWRTDVSKELCVDWKGRFYNTDMYHNNFLMNVSTDNGRGIYGRYDQTSGVLPVSGTDNVMGVTRFEVKRHVSLVLFMFTTPRIPGKRM